jgi:hypothetical protein
MAASRSYVRLERNLVAPTPMRSTFEVIHTYPEEHPATQEAPDNLPWRTCTDVADTAGFPGGP